MRSSTSNSRGARVRIRPCCSTDAPAIADVFLTARAAFLPWLPKVHADAEVRAWIANVLVHRPQTWVAELADRVIGFAALGDDHLDHLYVHPDFHHGGVGTALLQHVIFHRPNGLKLWVFQQNAQARRFYEHHGFVLLHQTDGAANEERTPDALYGWTPSHALRGSA